MYDVAIVGAGPAGSTLARLLAGRARVLLIDRRAGISAADAPPPVAGRVSGKLCGGLLAPAAQKELARQGLGIPSSVLAAPQLFAVRAVDATSGLERRYQRHYLNIHRSAFDSWLVSQARSHCDYHAGWRLTGIELAAESALLRIQTAEGAATSVTAKLVVGADGAASLVRRTLYPGISGPRYVAVQSVFADGSAEACFGAHFSALTDYYAWVIPKGEQTLAGAAFPRGQHVPARFDLLLRELRSAGFGLGDELQRASVPLVRPTGPSDVRLGRGRVALLGEAAGLISPSSAEGISYALRSAAAMAAAFEAAPADPVYEYRRFARPLVAEVFGKMAKSRVLQAPVARSTVLLTGIGALPEGELGGFAGTIGELLTP